MIINSVEYENSIKRKIDSKDSNLEGLVEIYNKGTLLKNIPGREKIKLKPNHFKYAEKYMMCVYPGCVIFTKDKDRKCKKH